MIKAGPGLVFSFGLIRSLAPVLNSQLKQKVAELVHGLFQNLEIRIGTFLPCITPGLFSRVTRVRVCPRWMRWLRGRGLVGWDGREASGEWKRREIGSSHAIFTMAIPSKSFFEKVDFLRTSFVFDQLPD